MFGSVFPGLCTENDSKTKKYTKKWSQGCILLLPSGSNICESSLEQDEMKNEAKKIEKIRTDM